MWLLIGVILANVQIIMSTCDKSAVESCLSHITFPSDVYNIKTEEKSTLCQAGTRFLNCVKPHKDACTGDIIIINVEDTEKLLSSVCSTIVSTDNEQTSGTDGCPKGLRKVLTVTSNNQCYLFSSTSTSYTEANVSCTLNGGMLAIINNNITQSVLTQKANEIADITIRSSYWIGLKRASSTSVSTVLGETSDFTFFSNIGAAGQEEDGCVKINVARNGQWITDECSSSVWFNGFICQFKGTNVSSGNKLTFRGIVIPMCVLILAQLYLN